MKAYVRLELGEAASYTDVAMSVDIDDFLIALAPNRADFVHGQLLAIVEVMMASAPLQPKLEEQ